MLKLPFLCYYFISLLLSYVFSFNNYNVKLFLNEHSTEELKELDMSKGEYKLIYLKFEPVSPITEQNLDQLVGTLEVETPFVLSDQIVIDTFKARFIPIYFGINCATVLIDTEYTPVFTLKEGETTSTHVTFPTLKVKISNSLVSLQIKTKTEDIAGLSFGLYSLQYNTLNVDPILIKLEKTPESLPDTKFTDLEVPPFDRYRDFMFISARFEAPDISKIETVKKQVQVIKIENNQCFETQDHFFSFTISNKGLADVGDAIKKEIIKRTNFLPRKKDEGESEDERYDINDIVMNIEINTYPSILSCGAQPEIKDDQVLIEKLKNINDHVKEMNENLFMIQTLITSEGNHKIYLRDLSRWATGFTVLCALENTATKPADAKMITIKFGNVVGSDSKINIINEDPQTSSCAVWTFNNNFDDLKAFPEKAIYACKQHFAKINLEKKEDNYDSNGCIQCDINANIVGTTEKPQKGICIRNFINCRSNFEGDLSDAFSSYISKLNTKAKIEKELGIVASEVDNVDHQKDDSFIEIEKITNVFKETDEDILKVNTKNTLDHTITCYIKKEIKHNDLSIVDDQFFQTDIHQIMIKPQESVEIALEYPDKGYTNVTYNMFLQCYNLNYEGKFYHSQPFIGFTVLKTDKVPKEDEEVAKNDCTKNPFHVECIVYVNHEPLSMLNYKIIPSYKQEINDFKRLSYPYQTMMIENEFVEMVQVQQRGTLVDKTIYLGHILGYRNCNNARDYKKCRDFKAAKIGILVNLFQKLYPTCDTLIENIKLTSTGNTSRDVVLFALALFQLGNNADSYTQDNYQFLFNITDCVIRQSNELRDIIFNYSEDTDIAEKSIIDFIQLLITHSANVIDIVRYLEMDGIIKANPQTNMFDDYYVKLHHMDYEQALTMLLTTTKNSLIFDNVHLIYFKREDYITEEDLEVDLKPTGSDPKMTRFEGPNMKITIQPRDLFILSNATYISLFVYDHYPYLSINTSTCSPNAVGLKFYKLNETTLNLTEVNVTKIPKSSYPIIQYNYYSQNSSFQSGLFFDSSKNEFVPEYSHMANVTKGLSNYARVFIYRSGDFTLGFRDISSWLWLIITLSVVGVILLGVGGYFLFSYIKKNTSPSDGLETGALIKEDV